MAAVSTRKNGKRRKNGRGSVYFSKSHNRWIGQYTVHHPVSKKVKRVTVYGEDEDQTLAMVAMKTEDARANPRKVWDELQDKNVSRSFTVHDLIEWSYEANSLKASTIRRYKSVIETWILPTLSGMQIEDVTPNVADAFVKSMILADSKGRLGTKGTHKLASPRSKQLAFDIINRVFTRAFHNGRVERNPFAGTDRPKYRQKKVYAIGLTDLDALLVAAKKRQVWADSVFALATGLRWGEQYGLKWTDIEDGKIKVSRTLGEKKTADTLDSTKTFSSERVLKIDSLEPIVKVILDQRRGQSQSEYVFDGPEGGTHQYSNFYNRVWSPLLKDAGLTNAQVSWHDMRHTFASYTLASGIPLVTVANMLGHKKASFTLDRYCHALDEHEENVKRYKKLINAAEGL